MIEHHAAADPVVVALGHTFPDLALERSVLEPIGASVVDGRAVPREAPLWARAAGILLGTAVRLDAAWFARLPRCRAVVRYGIGVDNVDLAAAQSRGIPVSNVRDYCTDEVAEHALACILALQRALPYWDRLVRTGSWRGPRAPHLLRLSRATLGVVGLGQIGRAVAWRAARIFGRVLGYDPAAPAAGRREEVVRVGSLSELLAASDAITLHVPLTDSTRNLIDAGALRQMKPGACLINVSRGGLVDEAALFAALDEGHLAGAALDTFVNEPLPAADPLIKNERLILSPHVAWMSDTSALELRRRASEEMARLLTGKPAQFPITSGISQEPPGGVRDSA
ncbi:MAG TPA: C-terminal binding protein [Geminicoccaceae bacterium]|nr:C-terminal binding protein [Geminicoccaceae bacterium]